LSSPAPADHAWWLVSRASGLVALALVTGSVWVGLATAARLGWARPRAMVALHEQLALAALVAMAVHGLALLGDPWLRPGLRGVAVPFVMGYRPLFTALGIVAAYFAALLGLSFYLRRWIGPRRWRALHRLMVVVYALALVHALGAGTDSGTPWLRTALLATAVPLILLLVLRGRTAARRARRRPVPAPGEAA
jgi:sulfoxide reductase heme-binding subunit YedZ